MTDTDAFKWIINKYKSMPLDFSTPSNWESLEKTVDKYRQVYPNSLYIELLERYHRALYELAGIDYIINVKGGLTDANSK